MSRVVYTDTPTTADQESLRVAHQVRLVTDQEEGTGVAALPGGVYGYTYSPGLPSAPLFAVRRFRSYEVHKLPSGDVFVTGFATRDTATKLSTATTELTLQVLPEPGDAANTLVTIPHSRIRQHRQYAAPNSDGFTVTVLPAKA
jgi:hypothetical protein